MKSIDLSQNIVKTRSGVTRKGRYFTSSEKRRQIANEKKRREVRSAALELLQIETRKARDERERKAAMLEAIEAKRKAGVGVREPIKEAKDGKLFVQPRIKGAFGKRIVLS